MFLREFLDEGRPVVLYEAPHRILGLLADISEVLGDRLVALGRELTKIHEYLAIRPISGWISDPPPAQGEFVLIVYPVLGKLETQANDQTLAKEFADATLEPGRTRREAIKLVADRHGVSTRRVFTAIETAKKSVKQPN